MTARTIEWIEPTRVDDRADFMALGYDQIKEPLNLWDRGQRWFTDVYHREIAADGCGLVLGATPWLAQLVLATQRRTTVVDMSEVMLKMCGHTVRVDSAEHRSIDFVRAGWCEAPALDDSIDVVVGDNSFSFLRYPDEWLTLCRRLSDGMRRGACLMTRLCSVPVSHTSTTIDRIVERALAGETINFTEVRATLLFAHWNRSTYAIDTESVLETFEAHRSKFDCLFERCPSPDNDLLTIVKYRGAGAVYYAPPLARLLDVIGNVFRIKSVHFGPYVMKDYFPLIVAVKE